MSFISRAALNSTFHFIAEEVARANAAHPTYPTDPLRRVALVCEESGEALKAALDLTRPSTPLAAIAYKRDEMRTELLHTAALAVRALIAMADEDTQTDLPTE